MTVEISISFNKDEINLGEVVTATYTANGYFDVTIQGDNMPNPVDLGGGDNVSGTMKFLPVNSGSFNVTLSGLGILHTGDLDNMDAVTASVTVN